MIKRKPAFLFLLLLTAIFPQPTEADRDAGWSELKLDPVRQHLAGIRVQAVEWQPFSPRLPVPARVVDPVPLLEGGSRLGRMASELTGAVKITALIRKRVRRLESLSKVSRRDPLEQARRDWLAARTRAAALRLEATSLEERLAAEWGPVLAQWAKTGAERLNMIARRRAFLVCLVLPEGVVSPRSAVLDHNGTLHPLEHLSPAPKADPVLAGPAHFFFAATPLDLRFGQRLTAWLTEPDGAIPVPAGAVVWNGGQPWVFVQTDAERFERRRLARWRDAGTTWWIRSGLAAGERVVTEGAQLLLAEEFRAQVPEEDDD